MGNVSRNIDDLLRRKAFYALTSEQRRALSFSVLEELRESFPGDPEAALEAMEPLINRERAD